ncbi:MAG: protein TolA, partial [Rubrivivax sp.]
MSATLAPAPPGGMAAGAAISVLAHAGLLVALALAVQWRLPAPPPVAAELWSSVPRSAAPPAAAPEAPTTPPPLPTAAAEPPPAP